MSEAKVASFHIHVCAACREDKYCDGVFGRCGVPYPYVCPKCKEIELEVPSE